MAPKDKNLTLAESLLKQEKFQECEKLCSKFLKQQPQNMDFLICRGNSYRLIDEFGMALIDFINAQKQNPNNSKILAYIGCCYFYLGNLIEAYHFLQQAYDLDQTNTFTLCYFALVLDFHERENDALYLLNKANQIEKNDWFTLWKRGEIYKRQNRFYESFADLNLALQLRPDCTRIKVSLAHNYACLGLLKTSFDILKPITIPIAYIVKAGLFFELGKFKKCKKSLKKAEKSGKLTNWIDIKQFQQIKTKIDNLNKK